MSVDRDRATEDRLVTAAQRARASWQRLWLRLRGTTPSGVAHALLLFGALFAVIWTVVASWPALLPFVVSGTVAYTVLPIVNRLDAFMPRPLAALLTMVGVAAAVGLAFWAIIPPVTQELNRVYVALQDQEASAARSEQFEDYLGRLPGPVQDALRRGADNAVANLNTTIDRSLDEPLRFLSGLLAWMGRSIGFILGLLVIPTWLLAVLKDQQAAARALDRLVPDWLAPDFWAVVRILDRVFGAFVRGQLVLGLAVGFGTWVGLTLLDAAYGEAGVQAGQYGILVALIAGVLYLVPVVGSLLGLLFAALIGLTFSREVALLAPLVVLVVQVIVRQLIAPHLERRVSDLHPAILVLAITALGQFGVLWIFVAAPIVAIARELYRYAYGRLADPPRPAGVLPGDPVPAAATPTPQPVAPRRVPLVYRRSRGEEVG